MCRSTLAVTAIVLMVGGPSGRRAFQTSDESRAPVIDSVVDYVITSGTRVSTQPVQLDDTGTYVGGPTGRRAFQTSDESRAPVINSIVDYVITSGTRVSTQPVQLDDTATYLFTNAESSEEQLGYTYNTFPAPSTVNFHDIYSNNLALLAEEPNHTTIKVDEAFHLNNMPTKFVEFHPQIQTIPPINPMPSTNSSSSKNDSKENITKISTTITTEESEDINVIPIKKDYQRGVLDLLFPAARVRTFKSVFDTFRRIMSYTFR